MNVDVVKPAIGLAEESVPERRELEVGVGEEEEGDL